jgi:hypothetical protein
VPNNVPRANGKNALVVEPEQGLFDRKACRDTIFLLIVRYY